MFPKTAICLHLVYKFHFVYNALKNGGGFLLHFLGVVGVKVLRNGRVCMP